MSIAAKDVVPFTQARATLSELADEVKQGQIITKNGESYVALIGRRSAGLLPPPGARAHPPAASGDVKRAAGLTSRPGAPRTRTRPLLACNKRASLL